MLSMFNYSLFCRIVAHSTALVIRESNDNLNLAWELRIVLFWSVRSFVFGW